MYSVVIFGCQVDVSDHLRDIDMFMADGSSDCVHK